MNLMRRLFVPLAVLSLATSLHAQDPGATVPADSLKRGGSEKVHQIAHVVTHTGRWKAADIEIEQDPGRPYVYVCGFVNYDAMMYDISNPAQPKLLLTIPGVGYRLALDAMPAD